MNHMKYSIAIVAGLLSAVVASASSQDVNDAQIASIVVTANQVDIDAGKVAVARATSPEVRAFAELMIADHTGVNKAAIDLVTKLRVTPEDNPTSQSLKAGGDKNLARLKALEGTAFDKAYVDQEVTYHQQVIDALDKTLIPGATNAELKALLIKVRPAFVAHLEHAKHLQASFTDNRPGPETHTVIIEGMRFLPEALTVAPGDTVVWVNKDMVAHTATSTTGGFDSKTIQAGLSWRFTIRETGDLTYICTLHPTMKALLRVES